MNVVNHVSKGGPSIDLSEIVDVLIKGVSLYQYG